MPNVNAENGAYFTLQANDVFQSVTDRALTPYGTREALPDYGFEVDTWPQMTRGELQAAIARAMLPDELIDTVDVSFYERGQVEAIINSELRVAFSPGAVNRLETTGIREFRYWPILNSPVRRGVSGAINDGVSFDLREYLRLSTAPIAVVREFAADIDLGAYTQSFGMAAERALAQSFYRMYANRNKRPALDAYMAAIRGVYVLNYTAVGGHNQGSVDVCVAAIPTALIPHQATLDEIRRAVGWLLPFYTPGTTLTVSACRETQTRMRFGVAAQASALLDLRRHS